MPQETRKETLYGLTPCFLLPILCLEIHATIFVISVAYVFRIVVLFIRLVVLEGWWVIVLRRDDWCFTVCWRYGCSRVEMHLDGILNFGMMLPQG